MRRKYKLASAVLALAMGTSVFAQEPVNRAQPLRQRTHSGRIIRSFTEPFQKSVAAGAVVGIVVESKVREGQFVNTGDPLAVLNRRVLETSLEIAKARAASTAELDSARSQLDLVSKQLQSLQALEFDGHTNQYELEQKQAEYDTAMATYQLAKDQQLLGGLEVKRILAELDDRIIHSPIDGFVTEIHKQPGENLSNNEPQYATIVNLSQLRIRFYVDAKMLREQKAGNTVVIEIGKARTEVSGVVDYVSPIIDSDSGVGRLEVVVENPSLKFQSGVVAVLKQTTGQNDILQARLTESAKSEKSARAPRTKTATSSRILKQRPVTNVTTIARSRRQPGPATQTSTSWSDMEIHPSWKIDKGSVYPASSRVRANDNGPQPCRKLTNKHSLLANQAGNSRDGFVRLSRRQP